MPFAFLLGAAVIAISSTAGAVGMVGPLPQFYYKLEVKSIQKQSFELECSNRKAAISPKGCLIRVTPSAVTEVFQNGKSSKGMLRDYLVYLDEKHCMAFDLKAKELVIASLGCGPVKAIQCSDSKPVKFVNEHEFTEKHLVCVMSERRMHVWTIHDPKKTYTIEELNH